MLVMEKVSSTKCKGTSWCSSQLKSRLPARWAIVEVFCSTAAHRVCKTRLKIETQE